MTFNQYNKNSLLSQLKAAVAAVEAMPVTRNCHECANFTYITGHCSAANLCVPPEVVKVGCEAYIYDHTTPPF